MGAPKETASHNYPPERRSRTTGTRPGHKDPAFLCARMAASALRLQEAAEVLLQDSVGVDEDLAAAVMRVIGPTDRAFVAVRDLNAFMEKRCPPSNGN